MGKMIEVNCPGCNAKLWIDAETGDVVQHKHEGNKAKSSIEDMLLKEKLKKENVDRRFMQAKNLEEEKKKKAEALFNSKLFNDENEE